MSNIIDKIQVSGVTYDIGGGGGKAIEAGRGITITTGETADTVSFNLPISAGTGTNTLKLNYSGNTANGEHSVAEGYQTSATTASHAEGYSTGALSLGSHAEGYYAKANGLYSHAEGHSAKANGDYSHAENRSTANGQYSHAEGLTETKNHVEHASGQYNNSVSASTTFGDSGNTLFSVGNGTAANARHNAFEIRQNGDIYLSSGGTDIKLQDHLGGGGSVTVDTELDSGSTNPVQNKVIYNKIDDVEEVTAAGLNALNDKITPTVELTQAQYDALVDKDPNTYYIITDAQAVDLTNYYTKSETNTLLGGKADTATTYTKTEVDTALSGKQATLVSGTNIKTINNTSILGSGNIDIQGGGKAIEAGRGIAITTGETADTVSFDLPISATTLGLECFNSVGNSKTGDSSTYNNVVVGSFNTIGGNGQRRQFRDNFIWGNSNKIIDNNWQYDKSSTVNIICGYGNIITGESNSYTSIFGYYNNSYKGNQTLFGYYNKSINQYETSFGRYNNSVSASTTWGDSGNTLFSVGNGTSTSARHNAFEIRQNGDIYLTKDGQDVKLQDQLGGSSITVDTALDSGSTNPVENRVIYNKIDEVEQVTAAGLNALNDNFGGLKLAKLSQAQYDALTIKDASTLYIILD